MIELVDQPGQGRGEAEEIGVYVVDEGHGRCVELGDDLLAVPLNLELMFLGVRRSESKKEMRNDLTSRKKRTPIRPLIK